MSFYTFAPTITKKQNHPFVTWDNAFTEEEIKRLCQYGDALCLSKATIDQAINTNYEDVRNSSVGWISNNSETSWLYDKLAFVARQLNAEFYGFDLSGFLEDMQYTVYNGESNQHYTWHIDMADFAAAPRKLSLVIQLSDPSEYNGGDLETMTKAKVDVVEKKKGMIAAFPSWVLHRVTPVTSGVRKSLVVWICGPCFK